MWPSQLNLFSRMVNQTWSLTLAQPTLFCFFCLGKSNIIFLCGHCFWFCGMYGLVAISHQLLISLLSCEIWWFFRRRVLTALVIGTSGWRSSPSAFRQSTGNDVSGHYKRHYFSTSSTFLIEGVLGSKNLFSKSRQECPKT